MSSHIDVVLKAEHLGSVLGFPITNSMVMAWVVMAIIVIFGFFFRRSLSLVPGRFQVAMEALIVGVNDFVKDTLGSERLTRIFFPLVMTIFLFLLVGNELEFFPGVGSISYLHNGALVPILRTPAADLNFTFAITFISFLATEIAGIVTFGVFKYGSRFLNFKSFLGFGIGLIELVSELARILSFSFRLFGNIFAGEVLVLVMGTFVAYLLPVPFIAFEFLVGFIQAAIFALLTLFFTKIAVEMDEAAHDAPAEGAPAHS